MEFQIVSWYSQDNEDENEFQITIFGRTDDEQSVMCSFAFEPFLYIEINQKWSKYDIQEYINTRISKDNKEDLINFNVVRKQKFYGFTNDKEFSFVKITFRTKASFKNAYFVAKKGNMNVYEANIEPLLKFIHLQNIDTTGYVKIQQEDYINEKHKISTCDHEIFVKNWKNIQNSNKDKISPIVIASFDIEVYSENGSFPDPKSDKNYCPVIQISTTFQKYGQKEPYKRSLITFDTCDKIENVDIIECEYEKDVIIEWCKLLQDECPDILVGYNIWKFDLMYLYTRAKKNGILNDFILNKTGSPSKMYSAKFSSSAYGDNEYNMVESIGIMQLDLLELYKREHKLVKYSLNHVSEHFLGDHKLDMPIKEMFAKFKGTSTDRSEIGKYCVKDTELPLQLIQKLSNIPNLIEMAKATIVPLNFLIERGQQIKVFSQIAKQCLIDNMLIITPSEDMIKSKDTFTGATVLKAKSGAYMDSVVTGLDFASLYPSIMRAHNLCYNTIVLEKKYKNIEGIEYEEVDINGTIVTYAQSKIGILPKLLENLAKNRKQAKKDMFLAEQRGDYSMKNVYNGKQLAFKVSMNSIYGFCAAYMLPCPNISASVTSIGRNMIEQTKEHVLKWYPGSDVIYGDTDSVMVIFNTGELKGQEMLEKSFELGKEAAERITGIFKKPIELEFEKCYWPYLLFSKKRYAGLMYTDPKKPDYIDVKGIQLVRRDITPFVKQVSTQILDILMYEKDVTKAMEFALVKGEELLKHKVNISDLTLSKSLRKDYKNQNLPHLIVADKMEKRDPGSGPRSGERVPYVFIEVINDTKKPVLQIDKVEDPVYVKTNGLRLDALYYLEHTLESPLKTLFDLFYPDLDMFKESKKKYLQSKNTNSKKDFINKYFKNIS